MSKTLTKQYYDGTLPSGYYYFNNGRETYVVVHHQVKPPLRVDGIQVVDKVPDYDKITKLEKKVELLQKQLKEAQNLIIYCSTGDRLGYEIRCENYRITHHLSKWGVK